MKACADKRIRRIVQICVVDVREDSRDVQARRAASHTLAERRDPLAKHLFELLNLSVERIHRLILRPFGRSVHSGAWVVAFAPCQLLTSRKRWHHKSHRVFSKLTAD